MEEDKNVWLDETTKTGNNAVMCGDFKVADSVVEELIQKGLVVKEGMIV